MLFCPSLSLCDAGVPSFFAPIDEPWSGASGFLLAAGQAGRGDAPLLLLMSAKKRGKQSKPYRFIAKS